MNRPGSIKFGAFGNNQPSYPTGKTLSNSPERGSKDSKATPKVEINDFVPKRFGLKYDPPSIILEYLVPSSGKLYHHKMKMPQLKSDSDVMETIEALKKKHYQYFLGNKISDAQIKALIEKLQKKLDSGYGGTFMTGARDDGLKGNKLGSLGSGFGAQAKGNTSNGLGSSANNTGTLNARPGSASTSNNSSTRPGTSGKDKDDKKGKNFWAFDDVDGEGDEEVDYNTTNLNKLTKEELQKHKSKMDLVFNKNQKKPGDKDFIYDKREEFNPNQDNEWDEEF